MAHLAIRADQPVGTDDLIAALWDSAHPKDVRSALQVHVARLRTTLAADHRNGALIETLPMGYALRIPASDVDWLQFGRLVRTAWQQRTTSSIREEYRTIAEALALWRGAALADVPSDHLREDADLITEQWVNLTERRFEIELALGEDEKLVGELRPLVLAHPLRESLWAHLMRALYLSGRTAEALDVYRQMEAALARNAGVDPSDALRRLRERIASGSPPELVRPSEAARREFSVPRGEIGAAVPDPDPGWPVLCQLPPDVPDFVGRERELEVLTRLLEQPTAAETMPIVNVSGLPGVGKSALTVHLAHRLRAAYPDGQWFVRLNGGAAGAREPGDVLAELLRGSGVLTLPTDLEARAAAFRARLADRRVLLLLDDAVSADQIVPLLPGTPGCAVVIASRVTLSDLLATHAARLTTLGVLSADECHRLLEHHLGPERIAAEPEAAAELIALCGRLPLALRVAAANLAQRPRHSLRWYVADLGRGDRIAKLTAGGGDRTPLQSAFDLAYESHTDVMRRLFRLLSLLPGPNFTAAVAADVAGIDVDEAQRVLDRLCTANLVEAYTSGRYRLHDLVRLYAAERRRTCDSPDEQHAGMNRVLERYLRVAVAAVGAVYPGVIGLASGTCTEPAPQFAVDGQALAWLQEERANLIAMVSATPAVGDGRLRLRLTDALRSVFWSGWHNEEWKLAAGAGLSEAEATDDRPAQWAMHYNLGLAHLRLAAHEDALGHLRAAERISRQNGLQEFEAESCSGLGVALSASGHLKRARHTLRRGVSLNRRLGLAASEARARRHLGAVEYELGDYEAALHHFERAAAMDRESGITFTAAENLGWSGLVRCHLGDAGRGLRNLRHAAVISRGTGNALDQAAARCRLVLGHVEDGGYAEAVRHAQDADRLAGEIGDGIVRADVLNAGAVAWRALGDFEQALRDHTVACELAGSTGHPRIQFEALLGLAATSLTMGRPDQAIAHLAAARKVGPAGELTVRGGHVLIVDAVARQRCEPGEARTVALAAAKAYRCSGHREGERAARTWAAFCAEPTGDAVSLSAVLRHLPIATNLITHASCAIQT